MEVCPSFERKQNPQVPDQACGAPHSPTARPSQLPFQAWQANTAPQPEAFISQHAFLHHGGNGAAEQGYVGSPLSTHVVSLFSPIIGGTEKRTPGSDRDTATVPRRESKEIVQKVKNCL
ncbi:hypothetical protein MATL_G00081940 [Megalops atlanticus]|uniref:Uncharacterized protein n=1 Tax=Megalops atlanticus TaxID=7932 RepID=A0A9D3TAP7_MEGAT|nr:hypothetical protein MATL_G00081940 [Megalops atlanticus]